ncbi:MAG: hypothetical protein JWM89_2314 [Acidimicrobiales bacterium]|nr:hypothetical protein [Acidimicrobiales bacterium]
MSAHAGDAGLKAAQAENFDNLNDVVAGSAFDRHLRFFNFGYRPLDGETPSGPSLGGAFPNRDSAQLLFEVVGDTDLTGARVVEVGCGRGGNLWLLRRSYEVAQVIGVDIAHKSVVFCRDRMPESNAAFIHGDAEQVPVGSGIADAVVSVETSCTYPDIESFFRDVARILKVGGQFLYTDLHDVRLIEPFVATLASLGLELTYQRDITANVQASRRDRAARQKLAFGDHDSADAAAMKEFVGVDGSELFDLLASDLSSYVILRFTKTADVTPPAERFLTEHEQAQVRSHAAEAVRLLTIPSASGGNRPAS